MRLRSLWLAIVVMASVVSPAFGQGEQVGAPHISADAALPAETVSAYQREVERVANAANRKATNALAEVAKVAAKVERTASGLASLRKEFCATKKANTERMDGLSTKAGWALQGNTANAAAIAKDEKEIAQLRREMDSHFPKPKEGEEGQNPQARITPWWAWAVAGLIWVLCLVGVVVSWGATIEAPTANPPVTRKISNGVALAQTAVAVVIALGVVVWIFFL